MLPIAILKRRTANFQAALDEVDSYCKEASSLPTDIFTANFTSQYNLEPSITTSVEKQLAADNKSKTKANLEPFRYRMMNKKIAKKATETGISTANNQVTLTKHKAPVLPVSLKNKISEAKSASSNTISPLI